MAQNNLGHRIGWIGVGRMGRPLATRLLEAGCDVAVYNRTRSKAEPLAELGAAIVDAPRALADRDIVFTTVAGPGDFTSVMLDASSGVLSDPQTAPRLLVDCSTISAEASAEVRAAAAARGATLMAAPISGNGRHVASGGALFAVSGPEAGMATVRPYLEILGRGAHYMGDADSARLVKIAHNLFLGAVIQSLVETSLLVEAGGVSRRAYLDFINDSPMGSAFSAYKTPALVDLDWTATFTARLLRKDLDLGLESAAAAHVELPVTRAVRDEVEAAVAAGHGDDDFAALLAVQAQAAGIELGPT
ncbi:MAG TPA: NAD(P)-dependent oxidoreductase [Solirubrobacteraceae bacterium]|nr:NAD(P)-dependent oxidoreductase [Solirubrobacteraceae bacterium]